MEAYTEFAQVYDRFMDNVPYEAWCEGISKILTEHGISEGTRTGSGLRHRNDDDGCCVRKAMI